ncbi:helix-turn-helix transcriptional regulator [Streptomyces sp. NPDC051940]|uniref:helix-turn-helix domain-containing protein n=1 Tax=Streptomyces sp. NPDC051940 TaxID=3155675 RepID=UPI00342CD599
MPLDPLPASVLNRREIIGARIRARRIHQNLTQQGLAEAVGIDLKTVHRIEYAQSDPRLSVLLLIADALDMPLAQLVDD